MPRFMGSAILAVTAAFATSAFAHAHLMRSVPEAGSTVSEPPAALTLLYTERVEPHFSQVQVLDGKGHKLPVGSPHIVGDDGRKITVRLPKLKPGDYTVVWHVMAADTHKTEGRFSFTVAP